MLQSLGRYGMQFTPRRQKLLNISQPEKLEVYVVHWTPSGVYVFCVNLCGGGGHLGDWAQSSKSKSTHTFWLHATQIQSDVHRAASCTFQEGLIYGVVRI
jgi:hypothetical protein